MAIIQIRDVNRLQPYMKYLIELLISKAAEQGMTLKVIETLRKQERQTQLNLENPKANPPLVGPHGSGCAADVVPLQPDGSIDWADEASFRKMGAIGKSIGLEWGGDWKKFDCPHFQYVGGLTDAQLRKGMLPVFPQIPGEEDWEMKYPLCPIMKGRLVGTSTLDCCSEPSNNARTGDKLKPQHEPFNIYMKVSNEGRDWYLVNIVNKQWVAAAYVKLE